jgi:hypothetical protein
VETLCTRDKNHFGAAKPGNPLFRKKKKKKKKKKKIKKHKKKQNPVAVVVP